MSIDLDNEDSSTPGMGNPGGPLNAVQFNNPDGTFAGSANLTFDGTSLNIASIISSGSNSIAIAPAAGQDFVSNVTGAGETHFRRNGFNRISLDSLGGIALNTGTGQDLTVNAAGSGNLILTALGAGDIDLNSASGEVHLQQGGSDMIGFSSAGAVGITPALDQGLTVNATGTGFVTIAALGTGSININSVGGDVKLVQSGSPRVTSNSLGQVLITPASGQNFIATTAGAGDIRLDTASDLFFDVGGTVYTWPTAAPTAGQQLTSTVGGAMTWEDAGGATATLQSAYDGGQTIDLLAATGNMVIDATDAVAFEIRKGASNVIAMSTTGAVTITPTSGANFISNVTGGGTARLTTVTGDIDIESTSGNITLLQTANSASIDILTVGSVNLVSASGQDVQVFAAGAGTAFLDSAAAGAVAMRQGGTNRVNVNSSGLVEVTPATNQDFNVSTDGSGSIVLDALTGTGTILAQAIGNVDINSTTGSVALQQGGTDKVSVSSTGAIDIAPTSGQDATITTAGGGNAVINAYTFPDLLVDTFSLPDTDGSANQVLTTDGLGVLTFEDSGFTAAVFDTSTGTTTVSVTGVFTTKNTLVIPAQDATFLLEGTVMVSVANIATIPACRLFNSTSPTQLGFSWFFDFNSTGDEVTCVLRHVFVQTIANGAQTVNLDIERIQGNGTVQFSDGVLTLTRIA